jgi:undecaprenyl-diphosphatase
VDYSLYKTINGLSGGSFSDGLFKLFANDLSGVLVALVALTFLIPWAGRRVARRRAAVLATAAAGLALLVDQPIANAVDRVRPYVTHPAHAHLLISRSHDPSFPSDHAAGAFAFALGLWLYDRTIGAVFFVLAAVLAFSRVYVGTHYPGDVAGGALVGAGVALLLYLVPMSRRLLEAVADRVGRLWDQALQRLFRRPATS